MTPTTRLTAAERLSALALGAVGLLLGAWTLSLTCGLLGWGAAEDALTVLLQGLTGRA